MRSASEARGLIPDAAIARFRADLQACLPSPHGRLGLAISGGPDSMAMLLLASAAFPGAVEAATVDHGLRPAARDEAALVARTCAQLGVPHEVLSVSVGPGASVQAMAREARYATLADWCRGRGLSALLTAHHADDQAETLLLRLARGAGLAGLSGIRANRDLAGVALVRPLLAWRRSELAALVADVVTVDDPSNRDPRHDRTHARCLLAGAEWIDATRMAASAGHLMEAEAALTWVVAEVIRSRCTVRADGDIAADLDGLPREIMRRVLAKLIADAESPVDGPTLDRALIALEKGSAASVGGLKLCPGDSILIQKAPARR